MFNFRKKKPMLEDVVAEIKSRVEEVSSKVDHLVSFLTEDISKTETDIVDDLKPEEVTSDVATPDVTTTAAPAPVEVPSTPTVPEVPTQPVDTATTQNVPTDIPVAPVTTLDGQTVTDPNAPR